VDEHGENLITVASGANDELTGEMVTRSLGRIDLHEAVVLANLEIREDPVVAAAVEARARGWRFVLNPAPARPLPPALVHACDVITPNETEASMLGYPSVDALLREGAGAVVMTRGPAGADLVRSGHAVHHQDAFPVRAVDTTGAGDAFSAALAWAVADGRDLEEGVRLAAGAGALAARGVGARSSLPERGELEGFVGDRAPGAP
jgi:ribokinase